MKKVEANTSAIRLDENGAILVAGILGSHRILTTDEDEQGLRAFKYGGRKINGKNSFFENEIYLLANKGEILHKFFSGDYDQELEKLYQEIRDRAEGALRKIAYDLINTGGFAYKDKKYDGRVIVQHQNFLFNSLNLAVLGLEVVEAEVAGEIENVLARNGEPLIITDELIKENAGEPFDALAALIADVDLSQYGLEPEEEVADKNIESVELGYSGNLG